MLTELERQTLGAWSTVEVGYGFGFNQASKNSGTPAHQIRRVVRSLARKEMLEYRRTLYWEDENKIGAGYVLTERGAEELGIYDD